ncbi:putative bifunctional diguanylate cyclase/phosphodiesterase [Fundidesulfovibrio soli]|uniref:putative bifunctional diguanylate cyclase/phosphodiesterase n=1 Tax=Fundidesulfovibrio soli TaxID=2922716 RepID=UPI001FAF69E4|nr:GGDEF and EAL domain-containing protein [Fundidesulfovibrio soli]
MDSPYPRFSQDEILRLLHTVLGVCREGVSVTAPDGSIEWVNPAFTTITGYEAGEVVGHNPRVLKSDRHDDAFYADMWRTLAEKGHWSGEIWNRRKSGEAYPEWLAITAVRDGSGALQRYVAVFHDLTDIKRDKDLIRRQTYHDALTNLPNRFLFQDRLGVALRNRANDGSLLGVICLDLDRFRAVNDSLGHRAGDQLLAEVARRLTPLLRQADTLSRYGGDTFYMLLTGLRDPEDAAHVAGRILTSLAAPLEIMGQELRISASVGIAISPNDGADPGQLMRNAEIAMYTSKRSGPSGYAFFTEDLGDKVLRALQMENDLRKALAREEFSVHYQPKVDLASGAIQGMEALVRWHRSDGTMVSPAEFIPLAEETGLIVPLGELVLELACRQARIWADEGHAHLKLAVNLSARQLEQPNLVDTVMAILERTGLPPASLELEVTESLFLTGFEQAHSRLSALTVMGITVALDDFGTGYSSLSYLKRLPISTLKIDRSFIGGLPGDPEDAAIVNSVVSIARNLGLEVVAEGVETQAQLDFLKSLGCGGGFQGYLFSRPVPARDFAKLLVREARRAEGGTP